MSRLRTCGLSRKNGGGYRRERQRYAVPLDWPQPLAIGTFYDTIMKPAPVPKRRWLLLAGAVLPRPTRHRGCALGCTG
jgi:hypothetical protein